MCVLGHHVQSSPGGQPLGAASARSRIALRGPGPQSVPRCGGAERDRPAGGVTAAQVTISPSPSPGQGEQALNRGESPQDRPLKPGAVGHGARKYHGGELRGGPRGYAAEPARGRKGIAPGLTPLEPPVAEPSSP